MPPLTAHFLRLTDFLGGRWPAFLPQPVDLGVMEHMHIAPLTQALEDDEARLLTNLYFSRDVILQLPGIDQEIAAIVLGNTGALAGIEITLHPAFAFRLLDIPLAVRVSSSFLRPAQLLPNGRGYQPDPEGHVEIEIVGTIRMYQGGIEAEAIEFSTPPLMIGTTGVVLQLEQSRLILAKPSSAALPALNALGFDSTFRGVYAKNVHFHWLPQIVLNGATLPGLNLTLDNAAIGVSHDQLGLSCEVNLTWTVEHVDGAFTANTELQGYLLHPSWMVALASLRVTLRRNQFESLLAQGMIRVPLLEGLVSASFGANSDGSANLSLSKTEAGPQPIEWLPGALLTLHTFHASGVVQDTAFQVKGDLSGSLNLDGLGAIALDLIRFELEHSPVRDVLKIDLHGLSIGPLGHVEAATLQVQSTDVANAVDRPLSVVLETTLAWQDLRQRLNLDQLPDQFPLPPDNAHITAYLNWEDNGAGDHKLVLRFAAELSDLGSVWSFIPEGFRPEVRHVRFTFEATYANAAAFQNASTSDTFSGDAAVELELRLPEFPAGPGAELFDVDREQWIEASLKGGVRSIHGANEGYMEMAIANAPTVTVNFPGLPQADPPIQITISHVDFDLTTQPGADSLTGHLSLDGEFLLRPINPAKTQLPVPPAMAAHMEKLFKAAGLSEFGGTATFDLTFKDDKAAVALAIAFDQATLALDLFDMIAGLARGMAAPQGMDGSANSIDLDLEVDIRLREIRIQCGSLEESTVPDQSHFGFELALDATVAGVQVDGFSFKLSSQEFSFGFRSLAVPIALPHFPISLADLNQLRGGTGAWDYQTRWLQDREPQLTGSILQLKNEIEALKGQLTTATGDSEASLNGELRKKRKALFEQSARKFLIESILAVHQVVGPPNRQAYQSFVEAYMALMDATLHQFAFDTKLDFVIRDVRFVQPFQNPTDIRVEGGAQLAGFKPDDPMAPLGDLVFKLGLSAEYIYFNVEGGDPIALPVFGEYENAAGEKAAKVSLRLNHARLGYGYSKNALVVALAGELKIARPLADNLNTADVVGIGVRLPERSRLGFKLDLIPIVLGEVDFLLPLLDFDIDLRKEFSPGIVDSTTCEPFWDGLQLVAPDLIRQDFKRLRFAPFFGSLLAPNYTLSFDLMLGDARNGLTHVCHDYLVIIPATPQTTIPLLADGTPFFNNLCTQIRLAGFGVTFDLQRPFPSMSPLALFEIFGLLADPMMPVDPDGALAGTIHATIRHARITLPPAVVRMFPEYGSVLSREINYTLNLGTIMTLAQTIAGPVSQMLTRAQQTTGDITTWLEATRTDPPGISPGTLLALLPVELRRFDLEGSFIGFDASAAFVLLTSDETAAAFAQRDHPVPTHAPRLILDETFDNPRLSDWEFVPTHNSAATWRVRAGELQHTGRVESAAFAIYHRHYEHVSLSTVLQTDSPNDVGVVFGYQDELNYYRFVMNPAEMRWELSKVRDGRGSMLKQLPQATQLRRPYSILVQIEQTPVVARPGTGGAGGLHIRILVDGRELLSHVDRSAPFTKGRLGLYCKANPGARFDGIQVHQQGPPKAPQYGERPDPAWLTSFRPNFSKPSRAPYNPTDPINDVLKNAPFDSFDATSLAALPAPTASNSGVLVGAEVKVLNEQIVRFLGYLFSDGTFSLISTLNLAPLRVPVAGITATLPLEIQGRLVLSGRAQGAKSFSTVTAQVWGAWEPVPGVVRLHAGSKNAPISLALQSNGRFTVTGSVGLQLFGGAATLTGMVDISQTHCLVTGTLVYAPDQRIGGQHLIALSLDCTGRIGPGVGFELSGAGTLNILGKTFTSVKGRISDQGAVVEARLNSGTWNWSGIDIKECTLAVRGMIDLGKAGPPSFLFEGDTYIRLFGSKSSKARAEIAGRGGIRSDAGALTTFVDGTLFWQGREWFGGRLELGTHQIRLTGRTAFALDLTPGDLPAGIQVANLYFRVELSGEFTLSATSGLEACSLDVDWALAAEMPGMDQQFPIAMQKKRFSYASGANGIQSQIELLPLVTIDGALFVPVGNVPLPIPMVTADQFTQYYWYWDNVTPSTKPTYQKVTVKDSGATTDPRFPTGIEQDQLLFSIPNPNPTGTPFRVFNYKLGNWKYLTFADDQITLPTIKAPRVTTSVPSSVPANEKFTLFALPTHFNASFSDGQVNLLTNLQFALTLAWDNGKLGVTVKKGNVKKFTPFDRMFG